MRLPQIVWLRRDLRMADQPALFAAANAGPVIPVYVLDDARAGDHAYGGASRWWLHHSLDSLTASLAKRHSQIVLRRGDAPQILAALAHRTGAGAIHAIRHYEPWWKEAEDELRDALNDMGDGQCELCLYDGNYLMPPGSVTTGAGEPYKIYTPFSKTLLAYMPPRSTLGEPDALSSPTYGRKVMIWLIGGCCPPRLIGQEECVISGRLANARHMPGLIGGWAKWRLMTRGGTFPLRI